MKRMLACMFMILACLYACPAHAAQGAPAAVIEARRSVFRILCANNEWTYSGSGFVLSTDGMGTYIATNYHVVEMGADAITILMRDGTDMRASIAGYDGEYDLCVLRTERPIPDAAALPLSGENLDMTGKAVYALGFPGAADTLFNELAYQTEDVTVTDGIISAIKQAAAGGKYATYLQMSAAINHGSSGGPLLNDSGAVVGVNTLGIAADNMFAAVATAHLVEFANACGVPYHITAASTPPARSLSSMQWVLLGGMALMVAAIIYLAYVGRQHNLTLEKLMARRLEGYPPRQAADMLAPLCMELRPLHTQGMAHANLFPHTLTLGEKGTLSLCPSRKKPTCNAQTKPFLPVEMYDEAAASGTYSDVYMLGALFYYLLTRQAPPDILTRLAGDTLPGCVEAIAPPARAIILRAMAPEKALRYHDAMAFLDALRME